MVAIKRFKETDDDEQVSTLLGCFQPRRQNSPRSSQQFVVDFFLIPPACQRYPKFLVVGNLRCCGPTDTWAALLSTAVSLDKAQQS